MTKANERRIRQSLERQRLKQKERQLELEAAERTLVTERAAFRAEQEALKLLVRQLCERQGIPVEWPEEATALEVLEQYVVRSSVQAIRVVPSASRALMEHQTTIGPLRERSRQGYGVRCTCNWGSTVFASEAVAEVAASEHVARMGAARGA